MVRKNRYLFFGEVKLINWEWWINEKLNYYKSYQKSDSKNKIKMWEILLWGNLYNWGYLVDCVIENKNKLKYYKFLKNWTKKESKIWQKLIKYLNSINIKETLRKKVVNQSCTYID